MGKLNLDKDGDLKRLEDEFRKMAGGEDLRELNDAAEARAQEQQERAAGILPKWVVATGIVAVLLIIGIIVVVVMRNKNSSGLVKVPDVVGQNAPAATSMLTGLGFRVLTEYDETSKLVPGKIVDQRPQADTQVPPKSDVVITIAGKAPRAGRPAPPPPGPQPGNATNQQATNATANNNTAAASAQVAVPDVVGMADNFAKGKLTAVGLKVEEVTVTDPSQREGVVIACDPKPNSMVNKNSTVRISVTGKPAAAATTGSADNKPVIGDYYGRPGADAANDLRSKGFVVSSRAEVSREQPSGYVLRTEPAANTQMQPGSRVTVVVAR
jgi:serine/threonine-protein kinase